MRQLTQSRFALCGSVSYGALLASLGLIGLSVSTSESFAACVVTSGSNYQCSAAETTPQSVNANDAAVSTNSGFSVNTNSGDALAITGNGALSYTDSNASNLTTTSGYGLNVRSGGDNGATPGSVTIQTNGAITGSDYGIYAQNDGSGLISVIASGAVNGTNGDGIYARNGGSSTSISVTTTGTVSGGQIGIQVDSQGSGAATVNANALVTGGTFGILATSSGPGGIVVNTGDVTGGQIGIDAANFGGGSVSVVATGLVQSPGGYGIAAANLPSTGSSGPANGKDISVSAADVSGGVFGIAAVNAGVGKTSVITSGAVSGGTYGIIAANGQFDYTAVTNGITLLGPAGTDLTVTANGPVTGGTSGIYAENWGTGTTIVKAAADVTGTSNAGIYAYGRSGTDVSVTAVNVSGASGISVQNDGTGATSIIASGTVTGTGGDGIYALANNSTGGGLKIQAAAVDGSSSGINAQNYGGGTTAITATGGIRGRSSYGIYAYAGNSAGTGLTVDAAAVDGSSTGIYAQNGGGGLTSVKTSGIVTSANGYGILASAYGATGTGVTVETAAAVSSYYGGIYATNSGGGLTRVVASGDVSSANDIGIYAVSENPTALGINIQATSVSGPFLGLFAGNLGGGSINVSASGPVSSSGYAGIMAVNLPPAYPYSGTAFGQDISITAASVTGGTYGIAAANSGTGSTSVANSGAVTGAAYGIAAINGQIDWMKFLSGDPSAVIGPAGTNLTVTANGAVSGGTAGIYTNNQGSGPTQITAASAINGGTAAIDALSSGTPINIAVTGTGSLRNASGATTDLALRTGGGSAHVSNAGIITGTLQLNGPGNTFNNAGTWNTAGGTSTFGGAGDIVTNAASGVINAAGSGAVATTTFDNVGTFINQGRLSLVNNLVGDVLQINGNARFASGSVYALDIDGVGNSDRILVNGNAQLAGILALNVPVGTQVAVGTRYTVLSATGGVSGRWDSIQGTAFLNFTLALNDTYDANNSYLLVQPRPFAAAALTPNQISTAAALDTIPKSGALFSALGLLTSDTAARNAFDQLSGETHASMQTALIDDSRFERAAAIDRLRQAFDAPGAPVIPVMSYASGGPTMVRGVAPERFSIWGQGFGSWGRWNGNGNAATLNRSVGGFNAGIDMPAFGTWRIGMMAGYTSTGLSARNGQGSSDNYHLGAYAGTQFGALGLRLGAIQSWHDIRTTRTVMFNGFNDLLKSSYAARTTQIFGELGYRVGFGAIALEPFGNLAYVNLRSDGFREVGGAAALTRAGTSAGITYTTLGVHASTQVMLGNMQATIRGTLGWRHAFGATPPSSIFAFAGSSAFPIVGVPIARDAAIAEAGFDLTLGPGATFGLTYAGQFARAARDQSLKANLTVRF